MQTTKIIEKIKAVLQEKVPSHDNRCKIQPLNFIAALISAFSIREGRGMSISALRNSVMELTGTRLVRGGFWERMATKKLVRLLGEVLVGLMTELCVTMKVGIEILKKLEVNAIYLIDSSSFTLPDAARADFPAPRNNVVPSAVKVHALFNLFGAAVKWFEITPATTHDRKGFPPLSLLKGSLIIFDLGYWDYQLLKDMIDTGAFFLSRVKSNAVIKVVKVVSKISPSCIGSTLSGGRLDAFRGKIVEFLGEITILETQTKFHVRVVGFWSTEDSQYHWYTTNLKVSSNVIYPVYRLRWQLELLWKSWKSYLHFDEIGTSNKNMIHCIILTGMCAGLMAGTIAVSVVNEELEENQAAFSLQSAAKLFQKLGRTIYEAICGSLSKAKKDLLKLIYIFKDELYDPNRRKRKSSIKRVQEELCSA